jgi:quercetin dioxygenase-like cupin family protein
MQRHLLSTLVAALLIGLALASATLAQPVPTPAPLVTPPGPVSHFAIRFDVVDAPEQFDRVLLIIDFPGGGWTPPHAPGGSLYATVIEGEVSSRLAGVPGETYAAGSTFTVNPGEYAELGNAATGNARVIATILPPKGSPLTTDRAGFSSDAYSGPTDDYRVLDSVSRAPRPATVFHSA